MTLLTDEMKDVLNFYLGSNINEWETLPAFLKKKCEHDMYSGRNWKKDVEIMKKILDEIK